MEDLKALDILRLVRSVIVFKLIIPPRRTVDSIPLRLYADFHKPDTAVSCIGGNRSEKH